MNSRLSTLENVGDARKMQNWPCRVEGFRNKKKKDPPSVPPLTFFPLSCFRVFLMYLLIVIDSSCFLSGFPVLSCSSSLATSSTCKTSVCRCPPPRDVFAVTESIRSFAPSRRCQSTPVRFSILNAAKTPTHTSPQKLVVRVVCRLRESNKQHASLKFRQSCRVVVANRCE